MPQPQPWQQSGGNEMQLLQQHIMFKQLQDFQRQQQQQNSPMTQHHPVAAKPPSSLCFPHTINGTPVQDPSQILMANNNMNWAHHGSSPSVQRVPQHHEVSLYGTPVTNARSNFNPFSHSQGIPQGSVKPTNFRNPFLGGMSEGDLASKMGLPGKKLFGQFPNQGLNNGLFNAVQMDEPISGFNAKQERPGVTLDPMEEKILFEGGFGNSSEPSDFSDAFPSMKGGSWSALMQSAVAEASSSDTGVQEEWSGLTFQNTEMSTDNQPLKHMPLFNDASMSSSNLDFHQSSHESMQHSPKSSIKWLDQNAQQRVPVIQPLVQLENSWAGVSSYDNGGPPGNKLEGAKAESSSQNENATDNCWVDNNHVASPFSNSTSELEQVKSGTDNARVDEEDSQMKHQNSYQRQNSNDSYNSNEVRGNVWMNPLTGDPVKHISYSQVLSKQASEGLSARKQRYFGQLNFIGNVSNSSVDLEKGRISDHEGNIRESEDAVSRGSHRLNVSVPFDGAYGGLSSQKLNTSTSQNMLELLQKVDQSRQKGMMHFAPECKPQYEVPKTETPETPITQPDNHSSSPQGFGLRLGPPSQRVPSSNPFLSAHSPPPSGQGSIEFGSGSPNMHIQNRRQQQMSNSQANPYGPSKLPPSNLAPPRDSPRLFPNNPFGQQFPILEARPITQPSGPSQQGGFLTRPNNVWTNIPPQRNIFGVEPHSNNFDASSFQPKQELNDQSTMNSRGRGYREEQSGKQVHESVLKNFPDGSESDPEAFDRSMKPSQVFHQNYSLLHQMQAMQGHNRTVINHPKIASQLTALSSQDTATFGADDSRSHSNNVGPTWFPQYGTLRNGQMLPMYDMGVGKTGAQASIDPKMALDASRLCSAWPNTAPTLVATENLPPSYALPTHANEQNLLVMRTKKRKAATAPLLPWYKEVTQGSHGLQNISMADIDWAESTNRVVEKVDDEAETIDGNPMFWSKKRLILTTHLMQQLIRPPPKAILSTNATSGYDSVAYVAAKLALGDACSLTTCMRSDSQTPSDESNTRPEKTKTPKRPGDQYFPEVVEEFSSRAKKLENNLLRLDKVTSLLDIRIESGDLEKFSIINRFAKFHSRGHADGADTSSSSGAVRLSAQKYVTAIAMPENVPEGAQCYSL